jgi:hypothetical protein
MSCTASLLVKNKCNASSFGKVLIADIAILDNDLGELMDILKNRHTRGDMVILNSHDGCFDRVAEPGLKGRN